MCSCPVRAFATEVVHQAPSFFLKSNTVYIKAILLKCSHQPSTVSCWRTCLRMRSRTNLITEMDLCRAFLGGAYYTTLLYSIYKIDSADTMNPATEGCIFVSGASPQFTIEDVATRADVIDASTSVLFLCAAHF